MRALVLNQEGGYAVEERPMPEPDTGEVLFRTHYSGICGTDLHAVQLGRYEDGVVIGHEFAGEVVSVGPGVEDWQAGDRAAVHPKGNVCGVCPECRDGHPNMCSAPDIGGTAGIGSNGGMAAYVSIPSGKLRSLPDEVSLLEGAWGRADCSCVARRFTLRLQGRTAGCRCGRGSHRSANRDAPAAWRRKPDYRAGTKRDAPRQSRGTWRGHNHQSSR